MWFLVTVWQAAVSESQRMGAVLNREEYLMKQAMV